LITSTAELNRKRAVENWETYFEEMEQANVLLGELRSDVSSESKVIVDDYSPRIEIGKTWLDAKTYKASYTVMSDRPAWVVFHAEENGAPGAILEYIFVESGTHSFNRTEVQGEMNSEEIYVMLHEDLGRIGLFEFPGPDGPVYVENAIVNELCFCPF